MISTYWIEKRRPHWDRLARLMDRVQEAGLKSLNRGELRELGLLYRQVAADLAVMRADASAVHFAGYLNQLLARAHNTIYSGHKTSHSAILRFYRDTYPQVFRRNFNYCLFAFILFLGGGVIGSILTLQDPDFGPKIMGPQMVQTIERHEMWTHSVVAIKPLASSAIMTNNLSVAFTSFAAGITAGLGTMYMIIFNGVLIGVIGAACAQAGMSLQLWSFVAPHGVLELPAIFISSGAGLRIAAGLLFPGVLPRRESLARAGRESVQLLLGCIPILFVAGLIEAFLSPTEVPVRMKFLFAASMFTLLVAYLSGVTVKRAAVEESPAI
ncbi:MAG TPA: stage II sporulation protein M [Terriglobales bacterium]|nr:stage II sporulation protein M [Terriglobales bacterium]